MTNCNKMMPYYTEYLEFVKKPPFQVGEKNEYNITYTESDLIVCYVDKVYTFDWENRNNSDTYHDQQICWDWDQSVVDNPNLIVIDQFPKEQIAKLIVEFVNERNRKGAYICDFYYKLDLIKYLYSHWYDYQNTNNVYEQIINEQINLIKKQLIEVGMMRYEDYWDMIENPKNPRYNREKHYTYYLDWLYCFYPLLENGEELILQLVQKVYLDDSQDNLLLGILKMEVNKLAVFYKKFLLAIWKANINTQRSCFNLFNSSTGALAENVKIIYRVGRELGYDYFEELITDKLLRDFWADDSHFDVITIIREELNILHNLAQNKHVK
jgi:hypothetical protein